jgi:hypothetical protein
MTEPAEDDFFAQLNAEIAEATAKTRLRADAEKLRKQALNMKLSTHERQRAAEDYKSIQAIVEASLWEPIKCGALFAEQTCDGCGSVHFNFLQFMQEERRVNQHKTRRWTRVPVPPIGLERETIIQPLSTHMCSDCCEDHEFNVLAPNIRLMPREGALTVSATYIQGDINGTDGE